MNNEQQASHFCFHIAEKCKRCGNVYCRRCWLVYEPRTGVKVCGENRHSVEETNGNWGKVREEGKVKK